VRPLVGLEINPKRIHNLSLEEPPPGEPGCSIDCWNVSVLKGRGLCDEFLTQREKQLKRKEKIQQLLTKASIHQSTSTTKFGATASLATTVRRTGGFGAGSKRLEEEGQTSTPTTGAPAKEGTEEVETTTNGVATVDATQQEKEKEDAGSASDVDASTLCGGDNDTLNGLESPANYSSLSETEEERI
jgi:hypothetical protein